MVLTPHALIGTAVYALIPNPWIGLPLAFFSHFIADWIPHNHYHKKHPVTGDFLYSFGNFLKVGVDFSVGMALCAVIAWKHGNFLFIPAGFLAMLPDAIAFFNLTLGKNKLIPPLQRLHQRIHAKQDPRTFIRIVLQPSVAFAAFLIAFL